MTFLANHVWQSTVVLLLAALSARVLARDRASVRYGLWLGASLKFLLPFAVLIAVGQQFSWRTVPLLTVRAALVSPVTQPFDAPKRPMETVVPTAAPDFPDLTTVLLAVWLAGMVALLALWWYRWRAVNATIRAACAPVDHRVLEAFRRLEQKHGWHGRVAIVASAASIQPGVFGIRHPVLLWPEALTSHLQDDQIEAVLEHELAHVRRRDNLTAAVHAGVQAVFWFHPLVWWVGRRLVDERERACDEAVLSHGNRPEVYAESILQTCRLGVRLPAACVSGMTGADLTSRIERIVHGSSKPGGARWRRNLVFIAAGVAIVGPLAIGVLRPRALSAKTPAVDGARPGRPTAWSVTLLEAETQLSFKGFSGRDLIRYAYGDDSMRVVDGPEWIDTQSASIEAGPMGANEHETRAILQSVLERQFGLLVHKEVRDLPVYALTVADTPGPGLRPAGECFDVDAWRAAGFPPTWTRNGRPSCGDSRHSPFGFSFKGTTMAQMADRLGPPFIDRVVVDTTRLDGRFDVDFTFFMPFAALAAQHPAWGPTLLAAGVPSVSRAMHEQLGLLLQEATQPTEVLVIDRALQP